jgi:hypothetical protein
MTSTDPPATTGRCLCGGVRFALEGELTPIQLCHATRCRKASGAACSPELLAAAAGLRILAGEDLVSSYEAPLLEEPPVYRRVFCRRCGSPLPGVIEGTPFAAVDAGTLDGDPGVRPFRHAFAAQKACWYEPDDGRPVVEHRPPRP